MQPEAWYAVQDTTVYPLSEEELVSLLDDPKVTLDVFDSAPLYARAMAAGSWGSSIVWDGKLAAYLLDASASHYLLTTLATSYLQNRRSPVRSTPMPVSWLTCSPK